MSVLTTISTPTVTNERYTPSTQDTLDKDDFLQLLITKMTHQDPLSPMEDAEFIAELAQFSSLEQMQNLNDIMEESVNWDYLQMQTINNTMATGLIGKDVTATYSAVYLDEHNSPQINFSTGEYASSVKVTISDLEGNAVRTLTMQNVPSGESSIKWDGLDENGTRMTSGLYDVDIVATDVNGDSFNPSLFITGRVNGVIYREGAAFLQVNGMEIALANVQAINEPADNNGNDDSNNNSTNDGDDDSATNNSPSASTGFTRLTQDARTTATQVRETVSDIQRGGDW